METSPDTVLDVLPAMVWTAEPNGDIDFVNRRWLDYSGFGIGDDHLHVWQATIKPEDFAAFLAVWQNILRAGEPGRMETHLRRHDGQYRWFSFECSPMRDSGGRVTKWYSVGTDITDAAPPEKVADRQQLDFQLLVDSMPVPVAVTTPSGEVEGLNRLTLEYFGKSFEELKGWKASDVVHPEDLEKTIAIQRAAHEQGSEYKVESRHLGADGIYRWFRVVGLPLRDPDGRILRWYHLPIEYPHCA